MSSIIVKGMKMPSNCAHCICANDDTRYCAAAHEYIPMLGKPDFCPLVALPDKHGRLVDADALIRDHFSPEHRIALSEANKAWMRKIINDAPTIVEAEDES